MNDMSIFQQLWPIMKPIIVIIASIIITESLRRREPMYIFLALILVMIASIIMGFIDSKVSNYKKQYFVIINKEEINNGSEEGFCQKES